MTADASSPRNDDTRGNNNNTNNNNNNNNSRPSTAQTKNVREFDEFKAGAIHIAKRAQDLEPRLYDTLAGPFYSMDVECVAIGYGHSDKQRYPGRVSLVKDDLGEAGELDEDDYQTLVDEIVNLNDITVISYMTELTGLTADVCLDETASKPLDDIRQLVHKHLPSNAILVGHSIDHDIHWLGLIKGVHFRDSFDTSVIFRQRLPKNLGSAGNTVERIRAAENNTNTNPLDAIGSVLTSVGSSDTTHSIHSLKNKTDVDGSLDENLPFETRYRTFSLRHCCINLLGVDIQETAHNPVIDARYSLLLFYSHRHSPPEMLRAVRDGLHRAPPTHSFSTENPVVHGVCMSVHAYTLKRNARFIW
eukprot:CAMPEP_0198256944 /NCGR_PEP_ID=MMETSP1447-20131203/6734_1 /TAXON_ID=420782 /ORGANISM="Chaetoceros dichaeta, Strain CCMP1751" /LENGTH=360 /DNA_ID=CAMNT_0043943709 /DNA_START=138 /DNA_END=1217 /DNA_ORIENTATION=-